MAEIAVNYVLDKLTALLQDEVQLHRGVKEEVQTIAGELKRIQVYLRAADEIKDVDVSVELLREVAYDIEDAIDEYNLRVASPPGDDLLASIKKIIARHQIASEIQKINSRVLSIAEGQNRFRPENPMGDIKIAPKIWHSCQQDALLLEEADLVGIEIPKKELIGWLLQGDTEREVVSVVGMGGLGKTTLVKKVYDDAEVKLQFKYRAWITVSTSFNMEELLKDLVRQLYKVKRKPVPREVEGMNEAQLRMKINSVLQQKKYLIVLDDVWHIGDWDAVKFAFPIPKNSSSRVMLTTRHAEVASASCMDFNGNVTKVYPLNPLSPEESWTLFCRKTFEKHTCAPDSNWKALADSILGRCEGLPLAIVAISGVLATKSIDEWDMIQRSLADGLEENDRLKSINKILSLSYYDLPYYLKSCFLYLSIFPDYHLIDKMRLIRLWIAEGFVKAKEGMTMEEVAEAYFDELLNRCLIQVAGTTGEGRIKTCRIHDLLREIIIRKSSEQNFLTIVRGNMMLPEKVRRLSIQKGMQDVHDRQRMSRLRSLLMFRRVDSLSESYNPILHPLDLKLLKVLDLEGAPLEIFPNEIFKMFHLKYLSLRSTKIKNIPSSIGKLQNLETLDLKNTCVTALPAEISRLQKLRHLLVYRYEVQSYAHINSKYGFKATAHITCLRSLQKLCFIEADHGGNDIMKELGCLNQLRRLGIVNFRTENGVALCSSIDKLENLRALSITSIEEDEIINLDCLSCPPRFLQRLYLTGKLEKFPHWISSLHSLAKVSLKWSQLTDDPLKSLQELPNLAQLDFLQVYEGETLHFKAEGFQKLKILSLDKMDGLKTVIVDVGAMPLLEKLILQRCKLLHSLPSGIEHLRKLKLLEFWDMPAELIMTIRLDIEGGDYWKVEHVPEINSTYWRDGGWDVYSLYRSIDSENPAPTRSLKLPSCWK
ncbi:disease resistance protein RPM1-like [Carya illinoinensis]|uniref:Uncharacterized protein n=1 Tax=Carya illinoinensis TaxID=32201 RepID=A0A8T1P4C0_CARIL|nr:disease resistance protein RPM1-like [Carya illinoinensis]KAG6636282.1 hypothetical protein CIPAW_11G100300 [Carya illinoinensis]